MNLIITNEFNKMDILKKLTNEKKFNNYKFYSFNELKRKLFFDYDNKTIEYVMKKYNVNLSIARIYIENLYFLKDVRNKKIEFLNNLKKELDDNNLLIYNNQFKNYLLDKKIIVYQNEELSKEEKYILHDFNYEVKKNQDSIYSPEIFEASDINIVRKQCSGFPHSLKLLRCQNPVVLRIRCVGILRKRVCQIYVLLVIADNDSIVRISRNPDENDDRISLCQPLLQRVDTPMISL